MRGFLASARRAVSVGAVLAAAAGVVLAAPQSAWAAPANDNFANATDLGSSSSGQVTGTNSGATLETGEPNHFVIGSYAQMSVWWRWTAPSTGWYAFNVDLSSPATFHPVVEVYDGTSVDALTRANPNASGYTTTVGFNAASGHQYHVVVASDGSSGDIVLRWAAQPANDDFADAAPLSGPSGTVTGTTIAATAETGEPQHFNDGSGSNHYTVWYSWVAPEDGTVTFDTAGSERAQVAVYTGDSLGALTLLGAQSIAAAGPVEVAVSADTTYRIVVGAQDQFPGDYKLSWSVGPPANDNVADAPQLAGQSTVLFPDVVHGSSLGATKEPGEPDHAGEPGGHSVWWKWAPWQGGEQISFDTVGSSFATVLAVYTRSVDGTLTPVAADNGSAGGGASRVTFAAAYNVEYYVAVDGVDGASGAVTLRFYVTPPVNDDFADATDLGSAPSGHVTGTNSGATLEPGEPNIQGSGPNAQQSVWWRWTAPRDGWYAFDISTSSHPGTTGTAAFYPVMQVYEGTAVDALTRVPDYLGGTTDGFTAVAGHVYDIGVANSAVSPDGFGTIDLRWAAQPANDDFADATDLGSAPSGQVSGTTIAATTEAGQPQPFSDNSGSNHYTVWYSWTAPSDGSLTVSTAGSQSAEAAVFTGDTLDTLTLQGAQNFFPAPGPISVAVTAGTVLRIMVGGEDGEPGDYQLSWSLGAPANDNVADAPQLAGQSSVLFPDVVHGSSLGATKEPGEPDHAGEPGGHSVWWKWAPWHGGERISFDTVGSSFATVLAVYTRSVDGTLTPVAADNGSAGGGASRVSFAATFGVNYYVAVDGVDGASGAVTLRYFVPPPVNDNFADAIALSGSSGSVTGTNSGATLEPGEPNHQGVGQNAQKSVWWRWTAPTDGRFAFDVSASTSSGGTGAGPFYPLVQVYEGNAVDALTRVPPTYGGTNVGFTAEAGQVYDIAVANSALSPDGFGNIVLRWSGRPANDDFADATPLTGAGGTETGSTVGATDEPGEPQPFTDGSGSNYYTVWYAWTAPADGSLTLDTAGSQSASVAAFSGDSFGSLTLLGAQSIYARDPLTFDVTQGTTYRFDIGGENQNPGDYQLAWQFTQANTPVANPVSVTTAEDSPATVTFDAADDNGDPLTYSVDTPPSHGTLSAVTNGQVTYTPNPNFSGADSFTYRASNGDLTSAPATVTITVTPVNHPPVCSSFAATTSENIAVNLFANCTDVDRDPLSIIVVAQPQHGSLASFGSTLRYTPSPNYTGPDAFLYMASDGKSTSAVVSASITVNRIDQPPLAFSTSITTDEDRAATVALSASDPDGDPLTLTISSPPSHGTLSAISAGQVAYTPNPNFNGADSFSYTANDGALTSAPATVAITVTPVNDPPVCSALSATTAEDTTVSVTTACSDVDGDALSTVVVSPPAHGTVTLIGDSLQYTPAPDYNGPDAFSYTASDGSESSSPATVGITVTPVNDPPVAHDDTAATTSGAPVSIDVLANDTDVDGDQLSITGSTPAGNGTASCDPTGCSYVPASGFTGVDTFTYTTSDGNGGTATATVTISVATPPIEARIGQPINADGSSVFKAGRGVVPVKFTVYSQGVQTCPTKAATITLSRIGNGTSQTVDEGSYNLSADSGTSFRISDCQYVYNLSLKQLPSGTYKAAIIIDGRQAGDGLFGLT